MRVRNGVLVFLCSAFLLHGGVSGYRVVGTDPEPWHNIFHSVGLAATTSDSAEIVVAGGDAAEKLAASAADHILIVIGDGALARKFGVAAKAETIPVRRIVDAHAPNMQVIWQEAPAVPLHDLPAEFQVFAKERWKDAPLEAGVRSARGAVLWLATGPGIEGYERYPYLLHALMDLGLRLPLRSANLWAFFDSAYRSRADVDYLARRWRQSGIAALHIAGWHNMEPDAERDAYLRRLIAACHRNAVLAYAWLELPHVSEEFWAKHPEWREKTAVGEDAQLDWRRLMNLQNPDCKRAVAAQVRGLISRFDWDGVNVAELYFESLEGVSNPARFTPLNKDVRRDFADQAGFDPMLLFDPASAHGAQRAPGDLRRFLDYRARLASRMQSEWLDAIDQLHGEKPWLDLVLTHIDDRLAPGMRDALGADTGRTLPLIQGQHATVLVEDPAPLWSLGPARYGVLAGKWKQAPIDAKNLAVDINVVERYQDVYPTKKQTGTELLQLVHQAASSFARVALYFENSLERQDLPLLAAAASNARWTTENLDEMTIESLEVSRLSWVGPLEIDGKPWPLRNANSALVPPGTHHVAAGVQDAPVLVNDFNGDLRSATVSQHAAELSYRGRTRSVLAVGAAAKTVELDGQPLWKRELNGETPPVLLPPGEHIVTISQ